MLTKTFCEFFAGIGLVGEALRPSGWDCVYANDIEPRKKAIFEAHYGPTAHYHLTDIWRTADVVAGIGRRPFLATASFPCTDLSLAGRWKGLAGSESSAYFGLIDVLKAMGDGRPPVVLLENVTGFLTANGGRDFPAAVRLLADLGYWIDAVVLDAKSFVPQSRPRLFVTAVHDDLKSPLLIRQQAGLFGSADWMNEVATNAAMRPPSLAKTMQSTPLPTGWFTLRLSAPVNVEHRLAEVIDLDDDQAWWDERRVGEHRLMMHDYHRAVIDDHVRTGTDWVGTIYRRTRKGAVRAEVRFDGIAGCLRTTKGGSARQIVCTVADGRLRMRWMSPREYARLQGAGDFSLVGDSEHQALFGFGDAVCVPVVRWLDDHVLTPLYDTATVG